MMSFRVKALFLLFFLLSFGSRSYATDEQQRSDLICHNLDNAECYPRVFRPTHDFQVVHDDQQIPKGLHVRMNFKTGLKEAKLYDPGQDTDPVNAVEIIPEYEETTQNDVQGDQEPVQQIIDGMYKASAKGSVKPPPGSNSHAGDFKKNVGILKSIFENVKSSDNASESSLKAFDELEELCHDIYWGIQLIEEKELLDLLIPSLISQKPSPEVHAQSAVLLSAALQNNKPALDAFYEYVDGAIGHAKFINGLAATYKRGLYPDSTMVKSRFTSFISKLVAREEFLADFVAGEGLSSLAKALKAYQELGQADDDSQRQATDRFRRKAADLVADHIIFVKEANQRFKSIHISEVNEDAATVQSPSALARSLADRTKWCEVLDAAYDIWRGYIHESREVSEEERWVYVPASCNPAQYDLNTGKLLHSISDEHREL